MQIGGSLALLAIGAILYFAVEDRINGVDLGMVGIILMVVGGLGLVLSLILGAQRREVPPRDPRV